MLKSARPSCPTPSRMARASASSLHVPLPVSGSGVRFGATTRPGSPFRMDMSCPAPSIPGSMGASCLVQSFGEWQSVQMASFSKIYLPRDQRSGVRSNVRLVSGRARGPMKGLQPMVKVIATPSKTARHTTTPSEIFRNFIITSENSGLLFDLCDAARMPPARKRGHQPNLHDFERQFLGNHSLSDRDNVGVVVFAREPRRLEIPAERAANSAHLVRHDRFAVARAAQHDAALALAARHRLRGRTNEQRVIDGLVAVRAEIVHFMAQRS